MLTALKKDATWLNEINSQSLQHSLVKFDQSFKSFFKHNTDYPKFQSKTSTLSYHQGFKINENRLVIPKFPDGIKCRDYQRR